MRKPFGSVENVARASLPELAEVDGVGENTAAKIRWALEESGFGYQA